MALTLQQLTGAAERLRVARVDLGVDWLALVERARVQAATRPFRASPLKAFIRRNKGKTRLITQAQPAERLIEEALRPQLVRAVEDNASESVHGYRARRSTYTAALALSHALAAGHHHVFQTDIRDFFDRIDWTLLEQRLLACLPESDAHIVAALARAPLRIGPHIRRRRRGIPLGRVISPYLANLYLGPVDAAMTGQPCHYLRYADDLTLLAPSAAALETAFARLEKALAQSVLTLNTDKTYRCQYAGQPIAYLGHAVDDTGVYDRVAGTRLARIEAGAATPADPAPATDTSVPRRTHTLYLTEPGLYLHMNAGILTIRRGRELLREIPIHRIDRVLALTGAAMSSGFFAECIARQIPVLFFVGKGKAFGSLVASGMPNPWRLRAQYELLSDDRGRLELARSIVVAKIDGMRRRARRTTGASVLRRALAEAVRGATAADNLAALRGFEGNATRAWYQIFARQIRRNEFIFHKRSKRPPRDPINSLLSFSYSLLFGEMQTALLAEGLDPHPGLLHESRPGHAALASDLIEPYRVLVADTFARGLVNRRRIHHRDHFRMQGNGGVYLNDEGRRRVLEAFEQYMEQRGPANIGLTPRHALAGAAANMLRVVLGEQTQLMLPPPFEKGPA